MPKKGRKKGGTRQAVPNDMMTVASSRTVGTAQNNFVKEDLFRRQQSWLLTQTPPKVVGNQIHWVRGTFQNARQAISNSVPTELNLTFQLSDLVGLVGLASFFDQFCIYSVTTSIGINYTASNTNSISFGTLVTAIDYDSNTTLGSLTAVQAFESSNTTELANGAVVQRLVKPAVAPALYNGSAFSSYGIARTWIDSASPNTPHYGLRSFFVNNGIASTIATYDSTYIIGFRNNY